MSNDILVPRNHDPFGQNQESRPMASLDFSSKLIGQLNKEKRQYSAQAQKILSSYRLARGADQKDATSGEKNGPMRDGGCS